MDSLKLELFDLLFERSFKKGQITLASGKTSEYYLDCKQTTLHQQGMWLVGDIFLSTLKELTTFPAIAAGVSLGGDPLVCSTVAQALKHGIELKPALVRKENKAYGTGKKVEICNDVDKSLPLFLLEDVVTTGGSSIKAINSLREGGFSPKAVIAIVDREEGGRKNIEELDIDFISIFTAKDFLNR